MMRVKKLQGTYKEICGILNPFNPTFFTSLVAKQDPQELAVQVHKDLGRSPVFGTYTQKIQLLNAWSKSVAYTQGDFFGCRHLLLPIAFATPVDSAEYEECHYANVFAFHEGFGFGYWSNQNEPSGISLIYKHRDPHHFSTPASREDNWMMCVNTNSVGPLDQRKITIYFSPVLCERFKALNNLPVVDVDLLTDLKESVQSEEVFSMVKKSIKLDGKVDIEECNKNDGKCPCFSGAKENEIQSVMKVVESGSKIKFLDAVNIRKSQVCSSIIDLIERSYHIRRQGFKNNAQLALNLANDLFERCSPYLSLHSNDLIGANWDGLQADVKTLLDGANERFNDFRLPELFLGPQLLYIEFFHKQQNLLYQNQTLSFRKAQVYGQLMSMVDAVQDLDEKLHQEDACQLFVLIAKLKTRYERLLALPEAQIKSSHWAKLQNDCNAFIKEAKSKISHYELPEKWCALELSYLELQALQSQCKQFEDPLNRKKAKVYKHLLELLDRAESLRRSDYRDDADKAIEVALKLTETCKPYLTAASTKADWKRLKKECEAIVDEAEYQLAYYGFFQLILANLLLAITGLCLVKAAFTGTFFIHNPGVECYEEFQTTASLLAR